MNNENISRQLYLVTVTDNNAADNNSRYGMRPDRDKEQLSPT